MNEQDDEILSGWDLVPDEEIEAMNKEYMGEPYTDDNYMKGYSKDYDDYEKQMDSMNENKRKIKLNEETLRGIIRGYLSEMFSPDANVGLNDYLDRDNEDNERYMDVDFDIIAYYNDEEAGECTEKEMTITVNIPVICEYDYDGYSYELEGDKNDYYDDVFQEVPPTDENGNKLYDIEITNVNL